MPRSNKELGVEPGARHTHAGNIVPESRWQEIKNAVQHPIVLAQLLLARYFGMRFEETALFRPHQQIDGSRVWINRGSKGGRPRYVVVHSQAQRDALAAALAAAKPGRGLIPEEMRSFKAWADKVYNMLRSIGVGRDSGTTFHDLRRSFAADRMVHLVKVRGYSVEEAIHVVARELGHSRAEVIEWYLSAEQLAALETPPSEGTTEAPAA
jgi:integrase